MNPLVAVDKCVGLDPVLRLVEAVRHTRGDFQFRRFFSPTPCCPG
jgi:hypothetical protein